MAEVLIHRIEFITNNLFGTYVAGDVIEVYLEENNIVSNSNIWLFQTTGVVTYLNGSPLASGGLIDISPGATALQNFNTQICFTTELVVPQIIIIWPYGFYYTLADHYSCAVVSATCDLLITGPAEVVPATGEDQTDGQITINATSSNTIEYSLDQITWQASAIFSALLPSSYRIFLRDSKNCKANILVEVPVGNDYGTIYRLEYDNIFNTSTTKLDITLRGYSGAVTEICGSDNPFELQLRAESSDKFQSLISTQGNLNLTSETDQFFIDLYTNDPNLYRLNYYKDNDLKWTGKILPFIYSEDYKSPPYYVTVTATDGLAELKDFYLFQKDRSRMFGKMKLIKIIAYCLSKLKLDLSIRVACNMYATGMVSTAADDPLDQAYVDLECFYIAQNEASLDFVIKSILDPFGCRIIQWEGLWHIIRVEEMTTSYTWRQFDSDGNYVSNGTTNPVVDIEFPSLNTVMFTGTPSLEIQPGFGTIRIIYKLGLKENLLVNGDFRLNLRYISYGAGGYVPFLNTDGWNLSLSDYPLYDNYEIFDQTNVAWVLSTDDQILLSANAGNAFISSASYNVKMGVNNSLKFKIRYNIARSALSPALLDFGSAFPYVKVRFKVKYGTYYLTNSGQWTTTDSSIDFIETKLNEWVEREMTAFQPGTDAIAGLNLNVTLYHATPHYSQFTSVAALQAFVTRSGTGYPDNITIPMGYKTELRDVFSYTASYMYYYEIEENTEPASGYDIIRPADYHATQNPRQWVLKYRRQFFTLENEKLTFKIDKVEMDFLVDGKDPIDSVVRIMSAEKNNKQILENEFIIGSSADLITSDAAYYYDIFSFFPKYLPVDAPSITQQVLSILSSDLLYTGWLRSSSNVAYDLWTRDGVSESDKLHNLWMKAAAAQYNKSWRLLRASLTGRNVTFSPLNSYKETNDSNRIYLPLNGSLNDFANSFSLELCEIGDASLEGSDGTITAPFTSAFTTGFGADYN